MNRRRIPRENHCFFEMNFGRTELIISVSRAKNCEEFASYVRFNAAPPKSDENDEKPEF